MRWAMVLAGAALVAAVAIVGLVIVRNRDTTPDAIRACAHDGGARIVKGLDSMGPLRVDALRSNLHDAGPGLALRGGETATFLRPPDGAYLVAAVSGDRLDAAGVLRRVVTEPERFAMLAYAVPREGQAGLRSCVVERSSRNG